MNSQVRRAVMLAVIGGAVSSGAYANCSTSSTMCSAVNNSNVVLTGGSTAVAAALTQYFEQALDDTNSLCNVSATGNPSQLEVYTDSYYTAYACNSNSAAIGVSAPIALVKESNAGSGNALGPVGGATALPFPTLNNLSSASQCTTSVTKPAVSKVVNGVSTTVSVPYTSYSCSVTSNGLAPNVGFADVDAGLFGHSATFYGVTAAPDIDIIFAPAVSLGLYRELQAVQGLTQDDALADMPSLTKAELTSIYTGGVSGGSSGVQDWSFFEGSAGNALGSISAPWGSHSSDGGSFVGSTGALPANTTIYICRRDDFSGTQKTMETYFGGGTQSVQGGSCLTGVNGWALANAGASAELLGQGWTVSQTSTQVFANKSTGNVLSCLEGQDSVGHYAIGYASIDNGWGANASSGAIDWRYVRVDGITPSIENATSGRWPIWAQSIITIPTSTTNSNAINKLNANAQAVVSGLLGIHGIGYYKVIEAVNAQDQWSNPSIHGGILAVPNSSANGGTGLNVPVDASASDTTFFSSPVNMYVKVTGAADAYNSPSSIDNCQVPTLGAGADVPNLTPVGGVTGFTPAGQ
jgi:hypothetical protein